MVPRQPGAPWSPLLDAGTRGDGAWPAQRRVLGLLDGASGCYAADSRHRLPADEYGYAEGCEAVVELVDDVVAHVLGAEGITNAVRARVDTIEHGRLPHRTGRRSDASAGHGSVSHAGDVPGAGRRRGRPRIRPCKGAAGRRCIAEDGGRPRHPGCRGDRCRLMRTPPPGDRGRARGAARRGPSTLECLRAATSPAADAVARTDAGVIRPGAVADLHLVDDSPLDDLSGLRRPCTVVRSGRTHRSPSYVRKPAAV